ncbi:MAG: hypothetical protein K1X55_04215 [Chitinophagales bacterium]|nr:hypothetical protein [Chitinophagales bacterium]
MYRSKLIQLYKTLSKAELRLFKKWVHSPFSNQHKDVEKLYDFLMSRSDITPVTTNRERAYNYMFPNEAVDDAKLRHIMSYSLDVLEEFVAYQAFHKNRTQFNLYLAKEYRDRKLSYFANDALESFKKELENHPLRDSDYLFQEFQYELEYLEQLGYQNRDMEFNYNELSFSLHAFFMAEILKHSCTIIAHEAVSNKHYEIPLIDEILKEVASGKFKNHVAVMVYFYIYKCLKNPAELAPFDSLNEIMNRDEKLFTPREWKDVYIAAINYCIKRANSIDGDYARLYNLYKTALAKGFLFENNEISRFTYKNIVTVGLILKDHQWVYSFIEYYSQFLNFEIRDDVHRINLAKYYFAMKDFEKTMHLILTVEFHDVLHTIDAKVMLLKIYYETNEIEALESFLESFAMFLRRKKRLGYHKGVFANIIHMAKKLIKIMPKDHKAIDSLTKELEKTKPIGEKNWFLEQLEKLK